MYGTKLVNRRDVRPGQLVKFQGQTWTASANTENALYLKSLMAASRTTQEQVEVIITKARDAV